MASSKKSNNHLFKVLQNAADAQKKSDHQTVKPEPKTRTESKPRAVKAASPKVTPKRVSTKSSPAQKLAPSKQEKSAVGAKKLSKRQDPDYFQVGFWLTRETSADLDMELAIGKKNGESLGDRSDVVEVLLKEWISSRVSSRS